MSPTVLSERPHQLAGAGVVRRRADSGEVLYELPAWFRRGMFATVPRPAA